MPQIVAFFLILSSTMISKFLVSISMLLFESWSSSLWNKFIRNLFILPLYANRHTTPITIIGNVSNKKVTCIAKFDSVKSMSSNTVANTKNSRSIASKMLRILELYGFTIRCTKTIAAHTVMSQY